MYHYNYLLVFPNGMKYYGVRSTTLVPELDTCYLGSGRYLPERSVNSCVKHIVATFSTRQEAVQAEADYIIANECIESDLWYNKRVGSYDKHGQTKETHEHIERTSHKLRGRTKETHEYIRQANKKRRAYSGSNRTAAQQAADKKLAETTKGIKNPKKACKGIKNGGFEPWYYIPLGGEMVKVTDIPKKEYAHKIGLTPRQISHRFTSENIGKPAKRGICKGWVFGNIKDLNTG